MAATSARLSGFLVHHTHLQSLLHLGYLVALISSSAVLIFSVHVSFIKLYNATLLLWDLEPSKLSYLIITLHNFVAFPKCKTSNGHDGTPSTPFAALRF